MPNITITLDEKLLKAGRQYAARHGTSLNALIRDLLEQKASSKSSDWVQELFEHMDRAGGDSGGKKWTRGDLYDV